MLLTWWFASESALMAVPQVDERLKVDERLSRIATLWTLLERAHGAIADVDESARARRDLVQRYAGAVYRYLLGAVRSEEVAGELFQEFALRILRGDFRGADRQRGHFRRYLKTSLIHLINDYHRARLRQAQPLSTEPAATDDADRDNDSAVEAEFAREWKRELMDQAWAALEREQPVLHAVLLLHVQQHDIRAEAVAATVARQFDRRCTAGNARVMLHRARDKFLVHLVEQVERSLPDCSLAQLAEELRQLQLLKLCEPVLRRRTTRIDDNASVRE
jgi:RNA polymerase sigma-70 factor (ECF subfamily)